MKTPSSVDGNCSGSLLDDRARTDKISLDVKRNSSADLIQDSCTMYIRTLNSQWLVWSNNSRREIGSSFPSSRSKSQRTFATFRNHHDNDSTLVSVREQEELIRNYSIPSFIYLDVRLQKRTDKA